MANLPSDPIRHYRKLKGLSIRELAAEAGVAPDTVHQIEQGNREPHGSTLRKLADVLGVGVADFFKEPTQPLAVNLWRLPQATPLTLERLLRAKSDPATFWDVRDILAAREDLERVGLPADRFAEWFERLTLDELRDTTAAAEELPEEKPETVEDTVRRLART
jgi:transcriptional regulator with XRE-family HTH domain